MGTLGQITLYSVLMLTFLSLMAGLFSFLAIWLSDQADDGDAAH